MSDDLYLFQSGHYTAATGAMIRRDWKLVAYHTTFLESASQYFSGGGTIAHMVAWLTEEEKEASPEHFKFARHLAESGTFDPRVQDSDGDTAYELALKRKNFSVATIFKPELSCSLGFILGIALM